jgi:hypothetical protein
MIIEAVSFQRACCVDIAYTESEFLSIGKAFAKEWPLQSRYIAIELMDGKITEPGRYVIFYLPNGNLDWIFTGQTCELYPPE